MILETILEIVPSGTTQLYLLLDGNHCMKEGKIISKGGHFCIWCPKPS